jgi:uncharacterized small protein (DUF1192 family)
MADRNKDLLARLADLSEASIQKLAEAPMADRAVQTLRGLADRVDELQRRTRGIDELEKRLTALEKKVDYLSRTKAPRRSTSAGRSRAGTAKKSGSTAKKT